MDPDLVMSLPQKVTADTGMDVLTHAIEAYVSNMASDFTDGLAEKASELIVKYLEKAYDNGSDKEAREKVHNASTIAGMAFTNAFLGINHSIAHKIGGQYHIPHGRANAVLLPHIIEYNSSSPTKMVSWPKYKSFIADKKYAEISRACGFYSGDDTKPAVRALIDAVRSLMKECNMPESYRECGIDEKVYMRKIPSIATRAFEDQCTTANPRLPLIEEIEELLKKAY